MKSDKKGLLVVISGPSGTGKDTILNELKKMDRNICSTVSATTRLPRKNEVDGINYHFLGKDEFIEKIENGEFIEYVKYGDNYYGTLKKEIEGIIDSGKIAVMVIEVRGAKTITENFEGVLSIFITAPSAEVLEERLRSRADDSEEAILKRLEIAKEEMTHINDYHYVVINDLLDNAVCEIYDIIQNRLKPFTK